MLKTVAGLILVVFSGCINAAALPDFTDLIKQSSPAVVKINTLSRTPAQSRFDFQNIPPQFREYFEQFEQPERSSASIGSGFIISKDGYIVTNHHVVDGATEITIRLNDRSEYPAEVIGADSRSDLALLKIDGSNLPIVKFAESENIEVGDWVLAIGSPFDLDYSASAGIVSAIGRSLPNGTGQDYVPFIQTDVAINPGNSGGPLFNMDGEVVGINSQILSRSGGFMGLSFAVPVSVAIEVIEQLKKHGTVARGWLGVVIQDVNKELAESFGLSKPQGALISRVLPGSPAELAGIRSGDIILKFDGQDIEYSHDLPHVVGLISPGDEVDARIFRQRKQQTIEVLVGELRDDGQTSTAPTDPNTGAARSSVTLGLVLEESDANEFTEMGIAGGVEVQQVMPDSPAAHTGLTSGDVIVQLNFEDTSSVERFRSIVSEIETGTVVPILFYRAGNSIFRTIRVDD